MEFIPATTPRWAAPLHLAPYVELLEQAPGGGLRVCCSTPPQHGKTETTLHSVVKILRDHPHLRNAYASYGSGRVGRVQHNAFKIAQRAYLPLETRNHEQWTTREGGQMLWTSVSGGLTGEPIDGVMIIDDPLKDRAEAESQTIRQNQIDWYHGTVETRLHEGASVIVMMTRWHKDDLVGYLTATQGFEYINLKAIADNDRPPGDNRAVGEPLWPEKHPLETLLKKQLANEWNFASLYQGSPKPRGGSLYKAPTYYKELPEHGFRVGYGLDLAYTEKTRAAWSVCVELWVVPPERKKRGDKLKKEDFLFYVVGVDRKQVEAPSFTLTLKARHSTRRARFFFYASGTEAGSASFIKEKGIPVVVLDTGGRDKLTRSIPTSELWNLGRILVPEDITENPWQPVFVDEITSFTGAKDDVSDQNDALVSGVDGVLRFIDDLGVLGSGGRYS